MIPQLTTPFSAMDAFESDFNLSEFLREMDELDQLQDVYLETLSSKRKRDLDVEEEPELKKLKSTAPLETTKHPSRPQGKDGVHRGCVASKNSPPCAASRKIWKLA
ncbi:hypothetical protein PI124_g14104 [Phytophthora idaei]|nr:hypothetical protein PI125_g13595 [Phytophthora idaei]KAG3148064.1 hypothetical protein PI126_g12608 [Phytophthora idaei]KAG3241017.1 hypothetical protein PI124_g14104 [Phytophthora idaei]